MNNLAQVTVPSTFATPSTKTKRLVNSHQGLYVRHVVSRYIPAVLVYVRAFHSKGSSSDAHF